MTGTLDRRLAALERAADHVSDLWIREIAPDGLTDAEHAAWLAGVQAENPGANIIAIRIVDPEPGRFPGQVAP